MPDAEACPECDAVHGRGEPHVSKVRGGRICAIDPRDCTHPFGSRHVLALGGHPVIVCLTCGQWDAARRGVGLVEAPRLEEDQQGVVLVDAEAPLAAVGFEAGRPLGEPAGPAQPAGRAAVGAEELEAVGVGGHDHEALLPGVGPGQVVGGADDHVPTQAVPTSLPVRQEGAVKDGVTIRLLADIPPFVDVDMRTVRLMAGDVATVGPHVAAMLVRKEKASLVEVPA
jgi:hypothetical protein